MYSTYKQRRTSKRSLKPKSRPKENTFQPKNKAKTDLRKMTPVHRILTRSTVPKSDIESSETRNERTSDWIQESSSQITSQQDNMNVTELIQDSNLFNISDIEDEAYQLAKYMESTNDQTNNMLLNINSTSSNIRQDQEESSIISWHPTIEAEMNFEQVNDMLVKHSTPIKDFGDECSSLCVSSSECSSNCRQIEAEKNADESTHTTIHSEISEKSQLFEQNCNLTGISTKRNGFADKRCLNLSSQTSAQNPSTDKTKSLLARNKRGRFAKRLERKMPCNQKVSTSRIETAPQTTDGTELSMPPITVNIVSSSTAYTTLSRNDALRKLMISLFNRPCFKYLNGRACRKGMCKWNHNLPSSYDISLKMVRLSNDTIVYMYFNFIVKSNMSFVTYFPSICDIFGSRKMETSLLNAIRDCDQLKKIPFYKCIYNGLIMTGLSKLDALTKILDCCGKSRASYDTVLEIMIEADPLYFIDLIKKYYRHGSISAHHLNKLLEQIIDTPAPQLLQVFIDILDQYSMYRICDVEAFQFIVLRVKSLVANDINMSQKLNNLTNRVK